MGILTDRENSVNSSHIIVSGRPFSTTWLRDNCLCPSCRHPENFSKLVDISELPGPPVAENVLLDKNTLVVEWGDPAPHRSSYPVAWLLEHGFPAAPPEHSGPARSTWHEAHWAADPPASFDIRECSADGGPWAEHLLKYGFAFFDDLTEADLDRFVTALGPVQNTEFGRFITVKANPEVKDLTTTGHALHPHTDFSTYLHLPPLLQFMLFIKNEADGGDSIFVDGFKVAEDFRADHSDQFTTLATTPVNFQQVYTDWRYFLKRTRPIIELDNKDEVSGVFFAHSHTAAWQLPAVEMDEFYAAYNNFFDYLKNPAYQLRTRMRDGQCVAMQNGRILHGRTAFQPGSGPRELLDAFVPWEYFEARMRFQNDHKWYVTE
ncbi:TauD/TfdA family dioxygenase [Amycolatopsis sp. NPDC059090]|uniref:TauD/TfdA family dioxygenase n=1 Tax=unclassified Amycolatopsis TaxID=2618356 RepID=UPI003670C7B3